MSTSQICVVNDVSISSCDIVHNMGVFVTAVDSGVIVQGRDSSCSVQRGIFYSMCACVYSNCRKSMLYIVYSCCMTAATATRKEKNV